MIVDSNPAPSIDPEWRTAARKQLIQIASERHPRSSRTRRVAAVGTGLLALTTIAAFAVVITDRPVTQQQVVYCQTNLNPDTPLNALSSAGGDGEQEDITSPIEACAQLWRDGILSADRPGPQVPEGYGLDWRSPNLPVPALTSCVNTDGSAVVIPASDPAACRELGLAAATGP